MASEVSTAGVRAGDNQVILTEAWDSGWEPRPFLIHDFRDSKELLVQVLVAALQEVLER